MKGFVLRVLNLILLILVIFAATRALVRALPGDPLETLIAESGTALPVETVRHELGLDRPFLPALAQDVRELLHGQMGLSLMSKKPVAPVLGARTLATLQLVLLAATLSLLVSVPLGTYAAARPSGRLDKFCSLWGALAAALPTPWIGPLLLVTFTVWIPLFPVGGHLVLPALALSFSVSGLWSRLVRERVREVLQNGSAPGARARGIPEWRVLLKFAFVPGAGALSAYLGTQLGSLFVGAFIIEIIFDWKGLGSLLVDAVLKRDYPVIEAATFVSASATLLGTFAGDCLQRWIDPRVRERNSW